MNNLKTFGDYITEKKWSGQVRTDWSPKPGTFERKKYETNKEMSDRISKYLKRNSGNYKEAMSRLNFYINRAGSNLTKRDKVALEVAKNKLTELYGKD